VHGHFDKLRMHGHFDRLSPFGKLRMHGALRQAQSLRQAQDARGTSTSSVQTVQVAEALTRAPLHPFVLSLSKDRLSLSKPLALSIAMNPFP